MIFLRLINLRGKSATRWLPFVVGAGVVMVSLALWQMLTLREHHYIEQRVRAQTESVVSELTSQFRSRIVALDLLGKRWERLQGLSREEWEAEAALLVAAYPGYQGVVWVDSELRLRWIIPLQGNEPALGLDIRARERPYAALEAARSQRTIKVSRPIDLVQGGRGFVVYLPLFLGAEFRGCFGGVFRSQEFLDSLLQHSAPGYTISVLEEEGVVYRRSWDNQQTTTQWDQEQNIELYGTTWRVRVGPTSTRVAEMRSSLPGVILGAGFLTAVLLAIVLALAQRATARARELEVVNQALEKETTERGRVEETLRASEEQYRSIYTHSRDAILFTIPDGRILSANPTACEMFGFTEEEFRHLHRSTILASSPEAVATFAEARARTGGHIGELVHRRKDGTTFVGLVSSSIFKDAGGADRGTVIIRDITERARAEEALRQSRAELELRVQERTAELTRLNEQLHAEIEERKQIEMTLRKSEERFAKAFRASPYVLAITRFADGLILDVNDGWEEVFQYSREEVLGQTPLSLNIFSAADRQQIMTTLQTRGRVRNFEIDMRCKSGEVRHVTFSSELMEINDELCFLTVVQDITERKQAERRMQQQLVRMALLHELTRAIGEHQDLASIFLTVLGRLESELPVPFAAMLLRHPHEAQLEVHTVGPATRALAADVALTEQAVIPVDPNGLRQAFNGQTLSEPDTAQMPFSFPQRLAQRGLHSLVVTPLQTKAEVFGVLVVARREVGSFSSGECEFLRQLSEHVALAVRQAQLHSEVRQAYDELRQTQHVLVQQERLRALGQMASGIAHDINNAMTPASLYVQDLVSHEAGLSPEGRDALVVVQTAIQDVAQTVARLREFYRKADPTEELLPVDLNMLVGQSVELTRARWRDQAQRQGITIGLKMQLQEKVPAVKGNASEVRELLVNLILNAVDAMPHGGDITIVTQGMPAAVVVAVRDTGVGMDEETKQRCLEPFYTTKGERGTGLGLAMVYGVVQRHGAQLEIDSEVGAGTTMRVLFPHAAATAVVPGATAGEEREVPMVRILLIDDEPLIRKAVGEVLRRWGHEVLTAASGEEGVEVFRTAGEQGQWFDVVITDLGMPKMDGKEVARRIKELAPRTPVIMLTGWGQSLSSTGERTPHVDVLLSKPPQLTDLRAALEMVTRESGRTEDSPA